MLPNLGPYAPLRLHTHVDVTRDIVISSTVSYYNIHGFHLSPIPGFTKLHFAVKIDPFRLGIIVRFRSADFGHFDPLQDSASHPGLRQVVTSALLITRQSLLDCFPQTTTVFSDPSNLAQLCSFALGNGLANYHERIALLHDIRGGLRGLLTSYPPICIEFLSAGVLKGDSSLLSILRRGKKRRTVATLYIFLPEFYSPVFNDSKIVPQERKAYQYEEGTAGGQG